MPILYIRNYDILAAVFTDVLRYINDDLDIVEKDDQKVDGK